MPAHIMESGEFAGWKHWPEDPFELAAGPFYMTETDEGVVCAFRVQPHQVNGMDSVHGGCFMTFADFCLFGFAQEALGDSYGVTVSLNTEFIAGARIGQLVEARGEVLRAGGSLIFVRGVVTCEGETCLNFSGTIKRLRNR